MNGPTDAIHVGMDGEFAETIIFAIGFKTPNSSTAGALTKFDERTSY